MGTAFTPVQNTLLEQLGFTDPGKDGEIDHEEALLPYKYKEDRKLRDNQDSAFANLAGAEVSDGKDLVITAADLEAFQKDAGVLANLIKADPDYQKNIARDGKLTFKTVKPKEDKKQEEGPLPTDYRLMTYLQYGLRQMFPKSKLNATGLYDSATQKQVHAFQVKAGLALPQEGAFLDRSTLGALVLRLNQKPADLIPQLAELQTLVSKDGQTLDSFSDSSRVLILQALQFASPKLMPTYQNVDQSFMLDKANQAIEQDYIPKKAEVVPKAEPEVVPEPVPVKVTKDVLKRITDKLKSLTL